ncbi:MAG: hypothetical protein QT11_C0001G0487 [archaeon GW2011_AR20]|nr:MAG: hypothetical protein QT11_C0001G0487 [archaeon GW2011_AR20]MBS3160547.1 hypothetical protein [Candidatus Woesearchaeota archaeon]
MTNEIKQVMEKLDTIKSELSDIKKHMVDIDSIMTEEDYLALIDYRKEKSANKIISHEQLKKQLGL